MKEQPTPSSFRFRRSRTEGLIEVLNEGSYLMAEYSQRTGVIRWQRIVGAPQRERVEKWLMESYPVQGPPKRAPGQKRERAVL